MHGYKNDGDGCARKRKTKVEMDGQSLERERAIRHTLKMHRNGAIESCMPVKIVDRVLKIVFL